MQSGYEAPDIDTSLAQRVAAANEEAIANFVAPRSVVSGTGALSTGNRASKPSGAALNDQYFETDTGWLYYWAGTAWKYLAGVNAGTDATRAAITVTANDNGALFFVTDKNKIWRVESGAWADKFTTLDLTTALKINGTKVIGTQGTAITDYTDSISGSVGDTLAAIPDPADTPTDADALRDDLVANVLPKIRDALSSIAAKENTTRARLRAATGHGLIA